MDGNLVLLGREIVLTIAIRPEASFSRWLCNEVVLISAMARTLPVLLDI
jgi:hypothetical protein